MRQRLEGLAIGVALGIITLTALSIQHEFAAQQKEIDRIVTYITAIPAR
jgi:hypothetical protein